MLPIIFISTFSFPQLFFPPQEPRACSIVQFHCYVSLDFFIQFLLISPFVFFRNPTLFVLAVRGLEAELVMFLLAQSYEVDR